MPPVNTVPKNLKPFLCHGVDVKHTPGSKEAIGYCPFCGKDKFFINVEKGLAQCKVCGAGSSKGGMNPVTFLRQVWEESDKATMDYDSLARDRKLLFPETLMSWGVVRSSITGTWMVPGYGTDNKLTQLYRYVKNGDGMALYCTSEMPQAIHGGNLYDPKKQTVYLTEGPWDAMALWEMLRTSKVSESGECVFSGEAGSLIADANVLAAPGANVFQTNWYSLFAGKDVILCYDSDHPRTVCKKCKKPSSSILHKICPTCKILLEGNEVLPVGYQGLKRVCDQLAGSEKPPNSIRYLWWGDEGFDPSLKEGYDVRDLLSSSGETHDGRVKGLRDLLERIRVIPDDWVGGRTKVSKTTGRLEVSTLECETWKDLRNAWLKAMKWTTDLEYGMTCILACVTCTKIPGDSVWLKVVSPPSTGKTTLVEGISVAKEYVIPKDTMTGLFSGYQTDESGKENLSLVGLIKDKTLVIKDADTIMKATDRDVILSQFRALYDKALRTQFKNKMSMDWEEIDTTVIICGTAKIRELDSSELGERTLDVVLMEKIDPELEHDVLDRMINRTCDTADDDETHEKVMSTAKRLTGGYVEYLRRNARDLWKEVTVDIPSRVKLKNFALFVAHMRARPSSKQDESGEREFGGRLSIQLTKLAKGLAVVLNKKTVDAEVLRMVRRCALDTARGTTTKLAEKLHEHGTEGTSVSALAVHAVITETRVRELLRFLKVIHAVEVFDWKDPLGKGVRGGAIRRWRLTPRLYELYTEVVINA